MYTECSSCSVRLEGRSSITPICTYLIVVILLLCVIAKFAIYNK